MDNNSNGFSSNNVASGSESTGDAEQGEPQVTNMLLNILHRQEQTQRRQTEIIDQLMQQPPRGEPKEKGKADFLRAFFRLQPPIFASTANPLEAEDWLTEIEKIFTRKYHWLPLNYEELLTGGMHTKRNTNKDLLSLGRYLRMIFTRSIFLQVFRGKWRRNFCN